MTRNTDIDLASELRIGAWAVVPGNGEITDGETTQRLETKGMDVLVTVARRAGTVVSKQQLVDEV